MNVSGWTFTSEVRAHPPGYTVTKQTKNYFKCCTRRDLAEDASVKITY